MTTIGFIERGDTLCFTAVGHAGYAKSGEPDIVCASISTLVNLLAELMMRAHGEGKLERPPMVQMESGNVRIICKPNRKYLIDCREQFGIIMIGLSMLEEQYPEHIKRG